MVEQEGDGPSWVTVERPGYFGKRKEELEAKWNNEYGEGNWRLVWETPQGQILTFDEVFTMYIAGYTEYFRLHPDEALYLTDNYSYAYDKDPITEEEAFDPRALFEKLGRPNQFHHVALNTALKELGLTFKGKEPIQVRAGKLGTDSDNWPAGWQWQPGLIPAINPEMIRDDVVFEARWWNDGSIEDLYQSCKALQVKAI